MAIVLEASRSAGPRSGRAKEKRATIREVCLIGREGCPGGSEDWRSGQRITWKGRGYRVVAAAPVTDGNANAGNGERERQSRRRAPLRQYVHLAACEPG
ncbi:MAG: hypothetical protein ACYC61_28975 [Isosphaeraceae bacterium]